MAESVFSTKRIGVPAVVRKPQQPTRRLPWLKLLVGVVVIAAVGLVLMHFGSEAAMTKALAWIAGMGELAPVAFITAYIVAAVLFIPGGILTIGAGFLFGLVYGTIYVSLGATLGATAAFLVGRYLVRDWVAQKLDGNPKFKAVDEAVAREGWKIVGLARLSPIFPFNLLNYAFGLTNIPLKDYLFASWAGMLPGTVMYVYIGTLAGDLARAETGSAAPSPLRLPLEIVGLIATVAVVGFVTRVARKALQRRSS